MTTWSNEQYELLVEILRHQHSALERLTEAVIQLLPVAIAPNYHYPLEEFASFDWPSIGAEVEQVDRCGPSIVSWCSRRFIRRSHHYINDAIWFSRCTGMGENGPQYERLITFRPLASGVSPWSNN